MIAKSVPPVRAAAPIRPPLFHCDHLLCATSSSSTCCCCLSFSAAIAMYATMSSIAACIIHIHTSMSLRHKAHIPVSGPWRMKIQMMFLGPTRTRSEDADLQLCSNQDQARVRATGGPHAGERHNQPSIWNSLTSLLKCLPHMLPKACRLQSLSVP